MKSFFHPIRILLTLALGYAIWFCIFIVDFSGNLRWAYVIAMGVQLALAGIFAYLLAKKSIQPLFAWSCVVFWIVGSGILPYYNNLYFFNQNSPQMVNDMYALLIQRPSIERIFANSSQVLPNAIIQATGLVLLLVGLAIGSKRPEK